MLSKQQHKISNLKVNIRITYYKDIKRVVLINEFDFIIIGGGIIGLSSAYELSKTFSVLVLEQEEHHGYHATGRSAAVFSPSYGSDRPALFALSNASSSFFYHPPKDFCKYPLLAHRGLMLIADKYKQKKLLLQFLEMKKLMPDLELISKEEINQKLPLLTSNYTDKAIYDDNVYDVDVNALQEGFISGIRKQGGVLKTSQQVLSLFQKDNHWIIETNENSYKTSTVVNAAGAWADEIAKKAGVSPVGIQPLRRTAILINSVDPLCLEKWPLTVEIDECFYIKSDAGNVLISPADETLSLPCDAQPEEIDVAFAAHWAEVSLGVTVKKINSSWSGLRTFVEDRIPVIGYSKDKKGFFWIAAVGGYGIQTSPAIGRLSVSLILHKGIPEDMSELGLKENDISPARCIGGINKND